MDNKIFFAGKNYTVSVPSDGSSVTIAENYEEETPKSLDGRTYIEIHNEGADDIRIAFSKSAVEDGVKVSSGSSISFNLRDTVYLSAISTDTNTGATLKVIEMI